MSEGPGWGLEDVVWDVVWDVDWEEGTLAGTGYGGTCRSASLNVLRRKLRDGCARVTPQIGSSSLRAGRFLGLVDVRVVERLELACLWLRRWLVAGYESCRLI